MLAPLALLALALPALADTLDAPGQPARQNAPLGQYDIVGNTLVSAQQVRARIARWVYASARAA